MTQTTRKWEYHVTQNTLPPNCGTPVPHAEAIEWFLNMMDTEGWEYVGPAVRQWRSPEELFTWFVFRRPFKEKKK